MEDSPKTPADGLDLFISAVEDEFRRKHPRTSLEKVREDLASRCMDRWLALDKREKLFFFKRDFRYKLQKQRSSLKKQRRIRDPNQPKRALTAYLYFCKAERRLLAQTASTLSPGDVTREVAKRWKQISPEQRQFYEELAAEDKQRYQSEMEKFHTCRLEPYSRNGVEYSSFEAELDEQFGMS